MYQIALRLDPAGGYLWGRERVAFTNHGSDSLRRVVLRLYPNFPGTFDERDTPTGFGRLQVGAARVADAPAEVGYMAGNTAVAIPAGPGAGPRGPADSGSGFPPQPGWAGARRRPMVF